MNTTEETRPIIEMETKPLRSMAPKSTILNPEFVYTHSWNTNIAANSIAREKARLLALENAAA